MERSDTHVDDSYALMGIAALHPSYDSSRDGTGARMGGVAPRRIDGGLGFMSSQADAQENHSAGIAPAISPVAPWRVAVVSALPNYRLALTFNDGARGIADLSALIQRADAGVFACLRDIAQFEQVSLVYGAVTWPNGADLDPCWLHEEIVRSGFITL